MASDASKPKKRVRDRWRVPYRLTGDQVFKMIEAGIIDGAGLELWDGILYKMTKGELHNSIVMLTAKRLDRVVDPAKYYIREEKSSTDGKYSLPEPDVAVARGDIALARPSPPPWTSWRWWSKSITTRPGPTAS